MHDYLNAMAYTDTLEVVQSQLSIYSDPNDLQEETKDQVDSSLQLRRKMTMDFGEKVAQSSANEKADVDKESQKLE